MNEDQVTELYCIRVVRAGALGEITMTRPESFNALDVRMAQDLRKAALDLARDSEIRAVILKGEGRVFCSGADLRYVRKKGDTDDFSYLLPQNVEPEQSFGRSFKEILEYIHSTISEIRRAPKPFVAAVEGVAAAGGFGLAMCCDLVLASENAGFEWAYPKTALTGAESSTFMLPRLVGMRKVFDLAFLNPRLTAKEALDAGLINRIFPAATFHDDVRAVGKRLADGPTGAFAITKRLVNEAFGMDRLDAHMDRELRNLVEIAETGDFAEGLSAFFAKSTPDFKGD